MANQKKTINKILLIFRDLLILLVIGNIIGLFLMRGQPYGWKAILMSSLPSIYIGYPLWKGIEFIMKYLDKKIPWLKFPVKRLIVQFLSLVIFCTLVVFLSTFIALKLSSESLTDQFLFMSLESMKIVLSMLFVMSLITSSYQFFMNWKKAAVQQEKLKHEHLALQYDTLKSQVNPHFLFNSLNSLSSLIEKDTDKAVKFVKELSEIYRYVLDQKDTELVDIKDEIEFLDSYIFLQKIRFGESLQVDIDISLKNRKLIPLSIQMLLENAIKHNVIAKDRPLKIDVYSNSESYIVVRNNIQKKTTSEGSTNIGLNNIKERYAFFTDLPMIIEENSDRFIVSIPTV